MVTAVLFTIGKAIMGFCLGNSNLEQDLRDGQLHRRAADVGLLFGADPAV